MTMKSNLKIAKSYARRGWPVIAVYSVRDGQCTCAKGAACPRPGKHPMTNHGVKDATTNPKVIRKWWKKSPNANIGIAIQPFRANASRLFKEGKGGNPIGHQNVPGSRQKDPTGAAPAPPAEPGLDLPRFVQKAFAELHGGERPEGDYLQFVAETLRPYFDGRPGQLIVNLPPRHAKTIICAVCLIAWELGQRPCSKTLVVACTEHLAADILAMVRQIVTSPWFLKAFPIKVICRKTELATSAGGKVKAVSIHGRFTGFGADLIIVDDAADIRDAANPKALAAINEIFDTKIMSRRNTPARARVIIIQHRLAKGDLSGHLLQGGGWEHIALPLISTKPQTYAAGGVSWTRQAGEALRPGAYHDEEIEQLKRRPGTPTFAALYQQSPNENAFAAIDESCFSWHGGMRSDDAPVIVSVDTAASTGTRSSFSVMQAWTPFDGKHVLLDQVRGRFEFVELSRKLVKFCKRHLPSIVLIEDNGVAQPLALRIERAGFTPTLVKVGTRSKTDRFLKHVETLISKRVHIAREFPDRDEFISEITNFPNGESDDQVDAWTQYLDYVAGVAEFPKRRTRFLGVIVRLPGPFL